VLELDAILSRAAGGWRISPSSFCGRLHLDVERDDWGIHRCWLIRLLFFTRRLFTRAVDPRLTPLSRRTAKYAAARLRVEGKVF
jgi:hypothetical protein